MGVHMAEDFLERQIRLTKILFLTAKNFKSQRCPISSVHVRKKCAGAFQWQLQTANAKPDVLVENSISAKCWVCSWRRVASHLDAQLLGA